MRRGFKAQAERLALAERAALDLTPRCRLHAVKLAAAKGIEVVALSSLDGIPDAHRRQLMEFDTGAFSGVTVVLDEHRLIVVNDAHTPERQANTISHEVAHVLLDHPPGPAFGEFGRTLSKPMEDEADWLAGCLLVPGSGIANTMQRFGDDLDAAAVHYGVSLQLMRWRHNVTKPRSRTHAA